MKTDCPDKYIKLVPLSRVVAAALIDTYEDRGKMQQMFSHWACRGLDKLQQETLKRGKQRAILPVNPNTRTATLPADFKQELFVGYINSRGIKIPLPLNINLTNDDSITDLSEVCQSCNQKKSICNDLTVTEDSETVVINDAFYDKTTIKKLYPNGDYFLEVTTPYYNTENSEVEYITTKEFIVSIALKPCGCIEETEENIQTIHDCCYDAWCCHFTSCSPTCDTKAGGYQIFEESGLIQFDFNFKHTKVYIEYLGFINKINGQLAVPEVAFETLVNWTKYKSVENKKSVPLWERAFFFENYRRERKNMEKMMGRISLATILQSISLNPKFDYGYSFNSFCGITNTVQVVESSTDCDTTAAASSSSGGNTYNNTINNTYVVLNNYTELKLIVDGKTGSPVNGATTYQNNALIGATGLAMINVNKNTEYANDDFVFNGVSGTITRNNTWQAGPPADVAVIDFTRLGNGAANTATAITDAATIVWDFLLGNVGYFTIGGNRSLSAISNLTANASGVLYVTQDGTGGRTLSLPTNSIFLNGWDGVIDNTAGAVTALAFFYDGTNYKWNLG